MPGISQPILIEQGTTFTLRTVVSSGDSPMNLSGYSARFRVWRTTRPQLTPVLDLELGSGILFELGGVVTVTATADQTGSIAYIPGRRYQYSLAVQSPEGHRYSLLSGRAVVRAGITDEMSTPLGVVEEVETVRIPDYSWIESASTPIVATKEPVPNTYSWITSPEGNL